MTGSTRACNEQPGPADGSASQEDVPGRFVQRTRVLFTSDPHPLEAGDFEMLDQLKAKTGVDPSFLEILNSVGTARPGELIPVVQDSRAGGIRDRIDAVCELAMVFREIHGRMMVSSDLQMQETAKCMSDFFKDLPGMVNLIGLLDRGTGLFGSIKEYQELKVIFEKSPDHWTPRDKARLVNTFSRIFNGYIGATPVAVGMFEIISSSLVEYLARTSSKVLEQMGIRYARDQGYVMTHGHVMDKPGIFRVQSGFYSREQVISDTMIFRATTVGNQVTHSPVAMLEPSLQRMDACPTYQSEKDLGPAGRINTLAANTIHSRFTLVHPVTYDDFFQANADALLVGTDALPGYLRLGTLVYHDDNRKLARLDLADYIDLEDIDKVAVLMALDASVENGGPVQLLHRHETLLSAGTRAAYDAFFESTRNADPDSLPFTGRVVPRPVPGWPPTKQGMVNLVVDTVRHANQDGTSPAGVHGPGEFGDDPGGVSDTWIPWRGSTIQALPVAGISRDFVDQFVNHPWSIRVDGNGNYYLVRNLVIAVAAAQPLSNINMMLDVFRTNSGGVGFLRGVSMRFQQFLETVTGIQSRQLPGNLKTTRFIPEGMESTWDVNVQESDKLRKLINQMGGKPVGRPQERFTTDLITTPVAFTARKYTFTLLVTTSLAGETAYSVQLLDGVDIHVDQDGIPVYTPLTGREVSIGDPVTWLQHTIANASDIYTGLVQQSHLVQNFHDIVLVAMAAAVRHGISSSTNMDASFDKSNRILTIDHEIAGHSFIYTINVATLQGTLNIDGQIVPDVMDACLARIANSHTPHALPSMITTINRWVAPSVSIMETVASVDPDARMSMNVNQGPISGTDVIVETAGDTLVTMLVPAMSTRKNIPVTISDASRTMEFGTFNMENTNSLLNVIQGLAISTRRLDEAGASLGIELDAELQPCLVVRGIPGVSWTWHAENLRMTLHGSFSSSVLVEMRGDRVIGESALVPVMQVGHLVSRAIELHASGVPWHHVNIDNAFASDTRKELGAPVATRLVAPARCFSTIFTNEPKLAIRWVVSSTNENTQPTDWITIHYFDENIPKSATLPGQGLDAIQNMKLVLSRYPNAVPIAGSRIACGLINNGYQGVPNKKGNYTNIAAVSQGLPRTFGVVSNLPTSPNSGIVIYRSIATSKGRQTTYSWVINTYSGPTPLNPCKGDAKFLLRFQEPAWFSGLHPLRQPITSTFLGSTRTMSMVAWIHLIAGTHGLFVGQTQGQIDKNLPAFLYSPDTTWPSTRWTKIG